MQAITQKELKEILRYEKNTGKLYWIARISKRMTIGKEAGTKSKRGYVHIKIKGKVYFAHRLAWLYEKGFYPKHQIDHINHDGYDNRWDNLREATNTENSRNRRISERNKSGLVGVSWNTRERRWIVQIGIGGKRKMIGGYKCLLDAAACRIKANKEYNYHENHGK